jgi:hypothetical protein
VSNEKAGETMAVKDEPNGVLYTYLYPRSFSGVVQANAARAELQRRALNGDAQADFFLRARTPATFLSGDDGTAAEAAPVPAEKAAAKGKKKDKAKDKDKKKKGKKDKAKKDKKKKKKDK